MEKIKILNLKNIKEKKRKREVKNYTNTHPVDSGDIERVER